MEVLHTYVERNQRFMPNYRERYRNGERIPSSFVESAVNQVVSKRMVKHQQMQWSQRGAHLLLQIRCDPQKTTSFAKQPRSRARIRDASRRARIF